MAQIIIIEEDESELEFMSQLLEVIGHSVVSATDSQDGLDLVRWMEPDLVIVGISMPAINGDELAHIISNDPGISHIPLLATVSTKWADDGTNDRTDDNADDKTDSNKPGIDGWIYKPIAPQAFISEIEKIVDTERRKTRANSPEVRPLPTTEGEPRRRARILVVDDHDFNRRFLSILLERAGYLVLDAQDGVQALEAVRREQIDLVISDILMPNMNGIELANRLHAESAIAHTPIFFYTATYRASEVQALAQTCGVQKVFAKPAEAKLLLDAVAATLGVQASVTAQGDTDSDEVPAFLPEFEKIQQRLQTAFLTTVENGSSLAQPTTARSPENRYALDNIQALSLRTAALLELSMILSLEREPQKLLELFCRAAKSIMHVKQVAVGMQGDGSSRSSAAHGMASKDIDAIFDLLEAEHGELSDVLLVGKPMHTQDLCSHPAFSMSAHDHPFRKAALLVPLSLKSYPCGWLYLADKQDASEFDEEDEQFSTVLAAQLAPVYDKLVLFDEVQRHAGELALELIERTRIDSQLRESEARFRQLAENIREVFFLADQDNTQMLYVSPAYEAIWGQSCKSLYARPFSWTDSIHPDDKESALDVYTQQRDTLGQFDFQFRIVRPDDSVRTIRMRGFPIRAGSGEIYRFAGIAEDITEQTLQAQRVAHLNRLYEVLSAINSAIVRIRDRKELFQETCRIAVHHGTFSLAWIGVIDAAAPDGNVVAWLGSEAGYVENIALSTRAEALQANWPASRAMREMRPVICNDLRHDPALTGIRRLLRDPEGYSIAAWPIVIGDRTAAVIELHMPEADFFNEAQIKLLDELASDLSFGLQFIQKDEKLNYLAYYDLLTGLPNNTLFRDRLTQFIHGAEHERGAAVVVTIDLQNFAQLNDAMGRHAGDAILVEAAKRLDLELGKRYSVARIGGHTFSAAITGLQQGTDVIPILEQQIFDVFQRPFVLDQKDIHVGIRSGLAIFPEDGEDAETLCRHANAALNNANLAGERYLYYSPRMNEASSARLALENELRLALEERQFVMFYQPRVDLLSGRIVGAEALIRWQHPQRGLLLPAEFLALAEDIGLMVPIGAWVIDVVCAQQAAWLHGNIAPVPVAVNLSATQFKQGQVLQTIRNAIDRHALPTQLIEFELTETVVMSNIDAARTYLRELKALGVKLSLDDFGTGYSSLAYLKRFPFDFVKIDRAFISGITHNPEDAAIANAVIEMAHNLKLRVVAEGVETEAQLNYLRRQRCDEIQGHHFSKPVPAAEFEAMLQADKRLTLLDETQKRAQTLLIVDDEPSILSALRRLLQREGYQLLLASSASEAMELLALNKVQVIVSDHRMPGMSGAEFLSRVKDLYPDTIRIILSGYADLQVITESVNRGAVFKFLSKPWNDDLLRDNIRDAFQRYRPAP